AGVVRPSGADDTDAIQAAFNAGDGRVMLVAGEYHVSRPILVDLTRFIRDPATTGVFVGAGMGATVIHRFNADGFPLARIADDQGGTDSGIGVFIVYQENADTRVLDFTARDLGLSLEGP